MIETRIKDLNVPASTTGFTGWYIAVDSAAFSEPLKIPISTILGAVTVPGYTADSATGIVLTGSQFSLALANATTPGAIPALSGNASQALMGDGSWTDVAPEGGTPTFASMTLGTIGLADNAGTFEIGGYIGHGGTTPKFRLESKTDSAPAAADAYIVMTVGTDTYRIHATKETS